MTDGLPSDISTFRERLLELERTAPGRDRAELEAELESLHVGLEERLDAEHAAELALERGMLEAVLEQLPSAVFIAEAPSGRVMMANSRGLPFLDGYFAEDVSRYDAYEAYRPDGTRYEPSDWPLARAARAGEVVTDEAMEFVLKDGSRASIEMSAAPVRRDGIIVCAVAILHDISSLERRERAEREFVINAAHELQTPLTVITSAVEVLQAGAKEIPDDRDRFLAHVQDECDRLARLVRSLLQLARAEMGEEDPPRQLVPVRSLLVDVAERVRPRPGVQLEVRCSPRLRAYTNRELAEQALVNLAGNAAKYTIGGRISLSARPVDAACLALEVVDTGPGIPAEDRERVFERFFRGGDRSRDGFGLGLAIAARTADVLDGRVELEAGGGEGTTMRLILPRRSG